MIIRFMSPPEMNKVLRGLCKSIVSSNHKMIFGVLCPLFDSLTGLYRLYVTTHEVFTSVASVVSLFMRMLLLFVLVLSDDVVLVFLFVFFFFLLSRLF